MSENYSECENQEAIRVSFTDYEIVNRDFFSIRITSFKSADLMRYFSDCIEQGKKTRCYGYSLTLFPRLRELPKIYTATKDYEIMVADGKGLYHLCRMFGIPLESDWALYEVADALLAMADQKAFSVMLLGADEENNKQAVENLRTNYPNAVILDGHHGYFSEEEESAVADQINEQNPDILLIGISSPKKEEFVWRNRDRLNAKIIVLMGGVIDIYAGKTATIPPLVKKLCLTWVYRFVQEPKRTRHIFFNGLHVLFRLIPVLAWARWVKKDPHFSIPAFYGVRDLSG